MQGDLGGLFDDVPPCYEFNFGLMVKFDDGMCQHCRKWLTNECDNIDEFVNGEEWGDE